jgi:rhodanese-related sulfurtransferase
MITSEMPQFQEFHIEGLQHISPQNALKELQNNTAIMIDVREETEVKHENIPIKNVYCFPMSGIVDQLKNIPTGKPVIVICNAGIRSLKVTNWLNLKGIHYSVNLDGGIIVWKAMGLPVGSGSSNENNFSEFKL